MATSLGEAAELLELAETSPGLLVCAPHILLSPTFRAVHGAVRDGRIGELLTARARYGWAGPWWGEWFYAPGGGSLFDLGVYNVTSLCALFGPARRVTAMTGVAIPEREVDGRPISVEAEDNAHVLLDFGDARFAVVTTGFTMQRYRSPAIEVYGREGTIQLLGDDWAPEGWELWTERRRSVARLPRSRPALAVDRGPASSRRLRRERSPDRHPARARLPRARDHARGTGRRPRRRRPHDRERLPRPGLRRVVRGARRRALPTTAGATMGYKPSPRPSFEAPTVIRAADAVRHTWGDEAAGFVEDWIYVSSQQIHVIVFGLEPGGAFRHSDSFRTVFAADELLHVLQGTLVLANPETGEVVRAEPGESVFFRRDTWHHGFSYGDEPLRVLELFAPPPATGTSGAYARTRPYLDESVYAVEASSGTSPAHVRRTGSLRVAAPRGQRLAARPRRARGAPDQHRAPDGRDGDRAGGQDEPRGVPRRRGARLRHPRRAAGRSGGRRGDARARATRSSCRPRRRTGTARRPPESPRRSSASPRASGPPEPRDMERAPAGARSDRPFECSPASGAGRRPTSR